MGKWASKSPAIDQKEDRDQSYFEEGTFRRFSGVERFEKGAGGANNLEIIETN